MSSDNISKNKFANYLLTNHRERERERDTERERQTDRQREFSII